MMDDAVIRAQAPSGVVVVANLGESVEHSGGQRSVSGRRKSGVHTLARKPLAIRRLARQRRVDADAGGGSAEKA
jgi:hypothetical protein